MTPRAQHFHVPTPNPNVTALYEAINAKDVRTVKRLLAPDLEWWFHGPPSQQHLMRFLTGRLDSTDQNNCSLFVFKSLSVVAFGSLVLVEGFHEKNSVTWVHASQRVFQHICERNPFGKSKLADNSAMPALVLPLSAYYLLANQDLKYLGRCFRNLMDRYSLLVVYGRILDIVSLKTAKLRGQAWVVFSEVTAASNAVRQMQNFPFYNKPMRIEYAKTNSDCIAKAEGTFDKKKKQEEKAERKRRVEEAQETATPNGPRAERNGGPAAASRPGRTGAQEAVADPNNILFIQNLPNETTSMMLEVLFKQYPGFREVRMIEAKPGIAFVEFEDDIKSSVAMQALQGFKITPRNPMAITYAKK
ncbi:hypothetical protein ACH5RR_010272 [Cinchona calisaya]|uniref:RRM domain-containing protein n=1 Tax=Cinchona calisaya TaxID=153742 RepID=A0ABD3AIB2_9GENT